MKTPNITLSILSQLPPEAAHALALNLLQFGLFPRKTKACSSALSQQCFGLDFLNPVGLAAGFDKDARGIRGLLRQGFGAVEIGTITPKPQKGNKRPRVFRLPEDCAVINRLGFNNDGVEKVARRLTKIYPYPGIVGANIGPNRDSDDPIEDYLICFMHLAPLVDYLVVNVSSPNTPGLRAWQGKNNLARLVSTLHDKRAGLTSSSGGNIPLLIKLAPDLDKHSRADIASIAVKCKVDGLLISNTTVGRPASLTSKKKQEPGGLSGRPLFTTSTSILADMYRRVNGEIPLVGIGGVSSGEDAYIKIRAGATLVQLYTALIYKGPRLIDDIKSTLAQHLAKDGFKNITAAIGIDSAKY
jgi:dihydroorotate dehydrogenase